MLKHLEHKRCFLKRGIQSGFLQLQSQRLSDPLGENQTPCSPNAEHGRHLVALGDS